MERQSLIFATGNKGKLKEAGEILGEKFEVIGAAAAGFTEEVEETGQSFQDNALLKSQALYDALGKDCFSDDSGFGFFLKFFLGFL